MKKRTIAMFLSVALCLSVALTGVGQTNRSRVTPLMMAKRA